MAQIREPEELVVILYHGKVVGAVLTILQLTA